MTAVRPMAIGRPVVRPIDLEHALAVELERLPSVTAARVLLVAHRSPLALRYLVLLDGSLELPALAALTYHLQRHAAPTEGVQVLLRDDLTLRDRLLLGTYVPVWTRSLDAPGLPEAA